MKKIHLIIGCLFTSISFYGQEVLSKEKAVEITLANNYDIKVTKNNVETAKNNKSIYNSGYLPTVTGNAGANYSKNDTDLEFQNGTTNSVTGAESKSYNASVGLNYTIFNGFNRQNTFKRLKENYNLTELQARQVMENTLTTLFLAYYEVGRLTENEKTQKETLEISKKRLERAKYNFDYGQNTKLEVLNAEVDVNNDSITYIDLKRQLSNAKRDLNVVLGRSVNTPVKVDTDVTYAIDLNLIDILQKAKTNNATILQAKKNIELRQLDVKINRAGWMPNVSLTSSYAWNKSNNDATNAFSPISNTQTGVNAGLSLSWNIFDGGRTKTNVANAKIALETQEIQKQQQEEQLERDVNNAWETYQNALFSLQAQEKNVTTNKHNFERTNERYKLGQITSIDFRQAQINLINAELSVSRAKYTAKNAELQLLQLAGMLLDNKNF
ncbi:MULTISPECIES: TolC family protein [unclassified Tenacibaculum]|uniref:TolC family protein n=1 Tax=unclassified Tenacibaculum TaxID=2635139 RepID=UPI001F414540|nr:MULTISPECIES: TolC family protein [unclassified Tenacibaculum]MCF2876353.1 TolC family protein [Tenacibaculum sp. Cn5-1]MCF2936504.1 TolC family protein [Tenacibaculum sp. Cn5-34]MCG7512771.1 TolC family protein [Tenacibaculum sp. Cn5-46]